MEKYKYDKFTSDQLKRRIKAGFWLTMILLVVGLIGFILTVYDYLSEKTVNTSLLAAALICFLIALIIFIGIKNAKNEMARRKGT